MLNAHDQSTVISLVYAHVHDSPEYISYVPQHVSTRKARDWGCRRRSARVASSVVVGGHLRRKACYKRMLCALKATCKFEDISRKF